MATKSELSIGALITKIPKAELHVHLEGTIEAELMFKLASRNGIRMKFADIQALQAAYHFKDLRDFLQLYNEGTRVLRKPVDFFEVAMAYLRRAKKEGIRHAEIFIDFQTYLRRNIAPEVQMEGLMEAKKLAMRELDISVDFILCFLRHLGPDAARSVYPHVRRFRDRLVGVGLASTEIGHPPADYVSLFDMAREDGLKTVAHAGEEGPWEFVESCIHDLKVDRIDHGNKSCENPMLAKMITDRQIPLTICPVSNIKLRNVASMKEHTIKKMLDMGMMVTINSDDPAYFGAYLNDNYLAVHQSFGLTHEEIIRLASNSFQASFLPQKKKENYFAEIALFER